MVSTIKRVPMSEMRITIETKKKTTKTTMATKMIKLGLMFLLKIGNLALGKLEVAH